MANIRPKTSPIKKFKIHFIFGNRANIHLTAVICDIF
jgi:hypothetical protein